ncbi:hypothetical protein [Nostoc sp.]|uniref:hypothetical protein n=1 Tax=Nostoc sp. TaxID=1180 RepID=UPI003FA586A5
MYGYGKSVSLFSRFFRPFLGSIPRCPEFNTNELLAFHKSLDLKWPDNIIPIFQPANSPELNPIERLWEHIKYELSWEYCTNLDQLRHKLKQVLDSISAEAMPTAVNYASRESMGLDHKSFLKCNFIENWY